MVPTWRQTYSLGTSGLTTIPRSLRKGRLPDRPQWVILNTLVPTSLPMPSV